MEKQEQRPMTRPKCKKAFYTFSLISIVLLLLLLANALYIEYGTHYSEYRVTDGITVELVEKDGTIKKLTPEDAIPAESHVRIHLPVPLHSDDRQYMLAFTAIRAYPSVFWNGRLLYSYDEQTVPRNHNFGAVPCMVELPSASYGSTVTIEEDLLSRTPQPFNSDIFVMPTKKSYLYYLQSEGLLFILYHTILTLSIAFLTALLFMKKKPMVKRGISIFLFLSSFVLWSLGYHHMLGFWNVSPYIASLLEYGALYFLPAPFLYYLFLSEKNSRRKKIYHALSLWFSALFAAAILLQAAGSMTLDDLLPLLHISILSAGLLTCWYQLHPLEQGMEWNIIVRWGILLSAGAAALVTLQYYLPSGHSFLHVRFMQALSTWALLIFVFSITLSYCFQLLAQSAEAQQKKAALRLAYHDSLTGLLNHAGIFKAADKLDPQKPYSLLFMDLNGLKEVNDLQGHLSGDTFIKRMADILRSSAGDRTLCGRVGGDEFVILFPPERAETLQPVMEKIQNKLASLQGQPHMPKDPSASFGWSIHTPASSLTFEDHLKEADDRMYEAKEAYKKSHPLEAGRVFTREK